MILVGGKKKLQSSNQNLAHTFFWMSFYKFCNHVILPKTLPSAKNKDIDTTFKKVYDNVIMAAH